ncbi:peptidoglycan-binding domain-containing protein [Nocardiopsis sp. CT-R113]|uniref:Peptidoglycan-binding domain-containing protein n=1 Tax=Nocardiopsis codii TaxID=3065942 RepID=A0ABU7KD50_9ACTN|nr:peptidoglycan-binding domain-containing protein [Nocardiopsis sp. CT-R113]MEE2040163.1 peptidoglycan-binding domain-containing protein [Nocardiopsis sp. CT-R113]
MTTIIDPFNRTVTDGWGQTGSGMPWALSGGTLAERSVAPGRARVILASNPGTLRGSRVDRPWGDGEVLAQFSAGQVSTGEALLVGLVLRRDPANLGSYYRARVVLGVDGSVGLSVTRGGTQLGAVVDTGLTYTPGVRLWARARVDGHQVRARVWRHGTVEPTVWTIDRAVTADTIPTGDLGVAFSAFSGNTNTAPFVDFHRVELVYRARVLNRLSGTVGATVSNSSLAATAETGTVTIAAPGARAVYDSTWTVFGQPAVRVQSGHHRAETPRLRVPLPASGPWSARWYTWMPRLQDAGHGTNEVRSVAVMPALAWTVHATAAGNVGTRLQAPDLAAAPLSWTTETGSAVATSRWWRCELRWDGAGTLTSQVFAGHATTGSRIHAWAGLSDPGRTLDLTGYRWRRRATLYWGDQGTEVRSLQLELLDLGYNLGAAGADGDFGDATHRAVVSFQTSRGVTPADGVPGPETRAAIDLALGRVPPPLWLSHVAVADGAWIGPAEPLPPPPVRRNRLVLGMRL